MESATLQAEATAGDPPAAPHTHPNADRITTVRADTHSWGLEFAKMWQFRSMVMLLIWRDFKVKYKQSALGAMWIILQPFANVMLYTFVFGRLAKMESEGIPYSIYNYVGMLPWMLFAASLPSVSSSLVSNANLIQKVHFPRALLPIYGALTCLPDFLVLVVIQLGLLAALGYYPTVNALFLPLFILWGLAVSLACGFVLSALSVRFRDATVAVAFLLQLWFYATPIVYAPRMLQGDAKILSMLNPMSWVVNGARWGLLGTEGKPEPFMLIPLAGTLLALVLGYLFFRRMERTMADVI